MGNRAYNTDALADLEQSRRWIPLLRRIIGPFALREGTLQEDRTEATDLTILNDGRVRYGCRVRDGVVYAKRYGDEVTITSRRETGALCEWDKMILVERPWLHFFFYGQGFTEGGKPMREGGAPTTIDPWYLIDLSGARPWLYGNHGQELGPNLDRFGKRCWFYAYKVPLLWKATGRGGLLACEVEGVTWDREQNVDPPLTITPVKLLTPQKPKKREPTQLWLPFS